MEKLEKRLNEIESDIREIDTTVAVLEKKNDKFVEKHGAMSTDFYGAIQLLMDERESLHKLKLALEKRISENKGV